MKILINAVSAKRGGIVTYTENLINSLRTKGIDVVFAVPPEIHRRHMDLTLPTSASEYGPVNRLLWDQTIWRLIVKRQKPDILFSSANFGLMNSPVPQILLIREGGLFSDYYLTNIAPSQGTINVMKRYFRRKHMLTSTKHSDHVLVPSEATRAALLSWQPELAPKCTVNRYGTLSNFYQSGEHRRQWKSDGTIRLLYVSVYYPHKNPGILCEAMRKFNKDKNLCHATITMTIEETRSLGGALDHALLSNAIQDGLVTMGRHPYLDLPNLYNAHDVFVFPSVSETFGHPMAEALSAGMPIVAADTEINREICGDAALYFSPFSHTELCARLAELDEQPGLRERLCDLARKRSRKLYNWDDHVNRFLDVIEKTVRGYHNGANT